MRDLPRPAQVYLAVTYLLGLAALAWLVLSDHQGDSAAWPLALLLAAAAGLAQVLTVARSGTHYSDHLTPTPVAAALLLLPAPLLALIIVLAFVPEWIWHRRKWYIQTFNIASWLAAAGAGRAILLLLTGTPHLAQPAADLAVAPPLALLAFLIVQTGQLLAILWLARGQAPRDTGLLAPTKLGSEVVLLGIGWTFAIVWLHVPLAAVAVALPLVLIFQALHVPNLKEEAATDPKTGLANARSFTTTLARALEQAAQSGQPVSLLMCDLDYLRTINNEHGHQAGDLVIQGVADLIHQTIRGADTGARFGGEEFAVLLPGTDRAQAWQVAERLRAAVERRRVELDEGRPPLGVTVSIGVAGCPTDGCTTEGLVREADLALYQAKRDGRNRVVAASRASRELIGEWTRAHQVAELAADHDNVRPFRLPTRRRGRLATPQPDAPGSVPVAPMSPGTPPSATAVARPMAQATAPPCPPVSRSVTLLIAAVVTLAAAGLGLAWLLPWPMVALDWFGLLLFATLAVLAEQVAVEIDGRGKTSVSAVAILGAGFLFDALGILVAAAGFALWAKLRARSPLHRMLFNFGAIVLAALAGDLTLAALSPAPLPSAPFQALVLPAALAGLAYYGVNHALLCLVRGLTEARSPWAIWQAHYRWLWPHYPVLGVLGVLLAAGYLALGWAGLLALAAPVGMMHLAFQQYMTRARAHVAELEQVNRRLAGSYEATLDALIRALDTRDEETEEHSRRVRRYTELIARRYAVPEEDIAHITRGALLHDIGKIGVPDAILLKPGALTEAERAIMRRHPSIGYAMIAHIPFLAKAAEVVLHHHEAYDGTGYPSGLAGEAIPLGARIFAVADTLDAMTSDRPYRRARTYAEALAEIIRCRGTQFDPRIVEALLAIPVEELVACAKDVHIQLAEGEHRSAAQAAS